MRVGDFFIPLLALMIGGMVDGATKMRVILAAIVAVSLLSVPSVAQTRPPGYEQAASAFEQFNLETRLQFQVFLIAAGYWNAVPNESFNNRTFAAIRRFQSDHGFTPDGVISEKMVDRLIQVGRPMLDLWEFRLVRHPQRGRSIWIPTGLGLQSKPSQFGLTFEEPQGRLRIVYNYFPSFDAASFYRQLTEGIQADGGRIHFRTLKDGWFVLSVTQADGTDGYLRYHTDGHGGFGFTTWWKNANGTVAGERLATLMSASLWSEMTGARFIKPPATARPEPETRSPVPPAPSIPREPATKAEPEAVVSMGTGFFVSPLGHVVTNQHVVEGCESAALRNDAGIIDANASIVGRDGVNDLALIKTTMGNSRFARIRKTVRLGEPIAVYGYPHADILASSGNFTTGNVSALAGILNNTGQFQLTAPIQRGNSGGPVLDYSGNVVGVVTSTIRASAERGTPQNVNFAVRASPLSSFLDAHQVNQMEGALDATLSTVDLADASKAISAFVFCVKKKAN
jgi:serine protease Do